MEKCQIQKFYLTPKLDLRFGGALAPRGQPRIKKLLRKKGS
jgi:hypothetical protein